MSDSEDPAVKSKPSHNTAMNTLDVSETRDAPEATSPASGVINMATPRGDHRVVHGVGLAVLGVMLGAIYAFGIAPLHEAEARERRVEGRISEERGVLQQLRDRETKLAARQTELREQAETLSVELRTLDGMNGRIGAFLDRAASLGIKVTGTKPDKPQAMRDFIATPITVTGTGGYDQLVDLLSMMAVDFRDMAVPDFEIAAKNATTGDMQFTLRMTWYALPATSKP